jgi:hypothetical protein
MNKSLPYDTKSSNLVKRKTFDGQIIKGLISNKNYNIHNNSNSNYNFNYNYNYNYNPNHKPLKKSNSFGGKRGVLITSNNNRYPSCIKMKINNYNLYDTANHNYNTNLRYSNSSFSSNLTNNSFNLRNRNSFYKDLQPQKKKTNNYNINSYNSPSNNILNKRQKNITINVQPGKKIIKINAIKYMNYNNNSNNYYKNNNHSNKYNISNYSSTINNNNIKRNNLILKQKQNKYNYIVDEKNQRQAPKIIELNKIKHICFYGGNYRKNELLQRCTCGCLDNFFHLRYSYSPDRGQNKLKKK